MRERLGRWWLPVGLVGCTLVLTAVFWLALAAVALIPSGLIDANLEQARAVVDEEGDYPVSYATGMAYDNFTVRAMLDQVGGMDDGEPPLVGALAPGYARYWHGYAVLLRPLLVVWGLRQIRFACQVAFAVLAAAASALLCLRLRKVGVAVACALVASEALVGAFDAVACLPLFPSFALSLAGAVWVLAPVRLDARDDRTTWAGFFLIGALTVYFDFLDNPVLALGMPLAVLAARSCFEGREPRRCLVLAASCCAMWLLGYGVLWGSKWVLAMLVTGTDVVGDALATARFRVGAGDQPVGLDTSPLAAIRLNFAVLGWSRCLIVLALAAVCAIAASALAGGGRRGRVLACYLALLVCIALIPYAWYAVLSNHSAIHFSSIAFRNQAVTFFSLGLALAVGADGWRAMRNRGRHGKGIHV